jgi:hypothetical protein
MAFPYTKPNRLGEVLWLIQILALHNTGQRGVDTLQSMKQPISADSWDKIGDEHPELFHVSRGKVTELSLIARRYQEGTPQLPPEHTAKLIETAIKIYDSQLNHSRWWIYLMPVVGAFVGAFVAIFIAKSR